jgi:plasmid stabilization system protein ParE
VRRIVWTDEAVAHLEAIVECVEADRVVILRIRHGARDEEPE